MTPCPRCTRGRIWEDQDGRQVCLLCSHVVRDETSLLERMFSNATPESQQNVGRRQYPTIKAPPRTYGPDRSPSEQRPYEAPGYGQRHSKHYFREWEE